MQTRSNANDIRYAAMNYLARREHSRVELEKKLIKKFPEDLNLVEIELDKLAHEKLQSDGRFAENYLRHRSERGYGLAHIRSALRDRGVSTADIEKALLMEPVDWYSLAESVFVKKFGLHPALDIKERAKRSRYMQYRGFATEEFQRLL